MNDIEKLYELLERAKKENDYHAVSALQWAIRIIEKMLNLES